VRRIVTRTEGRDTTPTLVARDAQAAAIIEWGIPDLGKLARLAGIRPPTLVANGDADVMVPGRGTASCSSTRTSSPPRSTPSWRRDRTVR
jgi:hypothetical protein